MSLKNITLSADEKLIQCAREKAIREKKTLNKAFREWLVNYTGTGRSNIAKEYQEIMHELSYVRTSKSFTRDELNEH